MSRAPWAGVGPKGELPPDDEFGNEMPAGDVTCKRCGTPGLEWVDTGVRWRLIDERGRPHECGQVAKAEDFD